MSNSNFTTLETKVDDLIQLCADMKIENQRLKESEHDWRDEKETLLGKNHMAKTRLEKVLERLKTIEKQG